MLLALVLLAQVTTYPTAAPRFDAETSPSAPAAAIGLLALAAVAALVIVRLSRKGAPPAAQAPPQSRRPAVAPPAIRKAPASRKPEAPEFEWLWGAQVGPAEELDIIGPAFHHRFLRRWGEWHPGELPAVGDASRPELLEELVVRVVAEGALAGSFDAWLKPVTDDPYDAEGVSVVAIVRPALIEKVASLSSEDAAGWHAPLVDFERITGRGFLVHGRVLKAALPGLPHAVSVLADLGTLGEIRKAFDALAAPGAAPRRTRKPKDLDF